MNPAAVQVSANPPFPLRCEPNARSLTYFATSEPVEITREVISWLIGESERIGRRMARICMHQDPNDGFHQMIIVQHYGNYYPPHRHPEKGEALHVIEGRVAFVTFNDDGSVLRSTILDPEDALIARCGIAQWHAVVPLSSRAVYHESKPGPYLGPGDSIFADWAPQSETPKAEIYLKRLLQTITANEARPAAQ